MGVVIHAGSLVSTSSVACMVVVTFLIQAHGQERVSANAQDKLVNGWGEKLVDRLLEGRPNNHVDLRLRAQHGADLERATLGKPGHLQLHHTNQVHNVGSATGYKPSVLKSSAARPTPVQTRLWSTPLGTSRRSGPIAATGPVSGPGQVSLKDTASAVTNPTLPDSRIPSLSSITESLESRILPLEKQIREVEERLAALGPPFLDPGNAELGNQQAEDEDPNFKNFRLWWTSELTELDEMELKVTGSLPSWLDGTLYRNGPGRLELGGRSVTQYFDGYAKIYKFRLEHSKAYYATKFILSQRYNQSIEANDLRVGMPLFNLDPSPSYLQRMTRLLTDHTDNPNVNVWKTGSHVYAVTDSDVSIEIDPVTLGTKGYGPPIKGVECNGEVTGFSAAHPARMVDGDGTINYRLSMDSKMKPQLVLYVDSPDMTRRIVGSVQVPFLTHIHSFAVTKNYAVVFHFPMQMDIASYLTGQVSSSAGALKWNSDLNTTVYIFDLRKTEAEPQVMTMQSFYALHQINAFEVESADGDVQLNIDLIAYRDGSFMMNNETFGTLPVFRDVHRVKKFYQNTGFAPPRPTRINIDLGSRKIDFSPRELRDPKSGKEILCELPRINDKFHGKESWIFYASCGVDGDVTPGQLGKIDMRTGKVDFIRVQGEYADEAVFVPDPASDAEDGGVLLTTVFDGEKKKTFLKVIDAQTLKEVARVYAPIRSVAGIHASWIPNSH